MAFPSSSPSLAFGYGAGGHRTLKQVGDPDLGTGYREHYIRDAQGNIMAIYKYTNSGTASTQVVERPIYGSSRLGSYAKPQEVMGAGIIGTNHTAPLVAADQRYELTDHLGNVSTVVTGRLLPGNGAGSAYQAEVVSAQGYEPFGALLPGRNYRQPLGPPPPPPETPKGTLVITEFSNGPSQANGSASGECEYVELYVTKCALYPDATEVDIRGWLIDDNAGNFNTTGGCTTGVSISSGHLRFVDHATWASVPVGTVIVVFNGADNCYNFTSNETGSGGQYFINVGSSTLIERTTTQPSTTGCDYCGAAYAAPGSNPWNTIALGNTADAIQVRCPDCPASEAGFYHGVGYGSSFGSVNAGTNDLGGAYFSGSGAERSYALTGTGCGTMGTASGWTRYTAPAAGTPPATAGVVDADVLAWLEGCEVPCCGSFEPPAVVQKQGYRFGFNGKENDNEVHGATGTFQDYGMRAYDTRVARFFAVDPLHASFPWLSPYQFASNTPIAANDVDGLEANLALYGQGSDEATFKQRAIKNAVRSTNHMEVHGIMSGDAFIERLQTATNSEGTIANFIFHSHAGAGGLFLRSASGFYSSWGSRTYGGNITEANMDDLMGAIESGSIRFEDNAVAVFLGCNVGGYTDAQSNYMESLASEFTRRTGVTSIASVGEVFPEIVDGKETGMSKSAGGFYRLDRSADGNVTSTFLGTKINALDYLVDATPKRMETRKADLRVEDIPRVPLSR